MIGSSEKILFPILTPLMKASMKPFMHLNHNGYALCQDNQWHSYLRKASFKFVVFNQNIKPLGHVVGYTPKITGCRKNELVLLYMPVQKTTQSLLKNNVIKTFALKPTPDFVYENNQLQLKTPFDNKSQYKYVVNDSVFEFNFLKDDIEVSLIRANKKQILFKGQMFAGPTINWIGDLDNDGDFDFILGTDDNKMGYVESLYLSSQAEGNEIVKKVASVTSPVLD